jgi:hypothetical protein
VDEDDGGTFQITAGAGLALPRFEVTDLLRAAEQRRT